MKDIRNRYKIALGENIITCSLLPQNRCESAADCSRCNVPIVSALEGRKKR